MAYDCASKHGTARVLMGVGMWIVPLQALVPLVHSLPPGRPLAAPIARAERQSPLLTPCPHPRCPFRRRQPPPILMTVQEPAGKSAILLGCS